ncbi:MAG: nucleotidyltransferase domain-containing protein [Patescibacteria group bacterium]
MNQREILDKYQAVEKSFFEDIKSIVGSNLLLYCVTGSLARNDIIIDWSDIDVLLVFEDYNEKVFSALNYALSRNKTNIKIGTTFFSFIEFISSDFYKDPKTHHTMRLICSDFLKPRIISDRIKLHEPSKHVTEWFSRVSFTEILFDLKRKLIVYDADQEKAVFKDISILIKIILFCQNGDICFGYKETFDKAKKYLSGFVFDLELPSEILNTPHLAGERRHIYINFLNWLAGYPTIHNKTRDKQSI